MFLSREPLQALEALGRLSVAEERDPVLKLVDRLCSPIVPTSSIAQSRLYPNPGFLGSSSFEAVVHELSDQNQQCITTPENIRIDREVARATAQSTQDLQRVENGADVLRLALNLRKFDATKLLFSEWRGHGSEQFLGSTCATLFQESFSADMAEIERSTDQTNSILSMSRRLFENSTKPFDISDTMSVKEFYSLYTESNLRWETIGFKTWRRLHDAVSALFALGLHEELVEGPKAPLFVVQLRKRIFARIYGADISFATFLGRPPRISKRFCCIHVPLDLEEEVYEYEREKLTNEMQSVDQNGWNTKGEIRKHAGRRWSMILAIIREDILEVLLGRHPTNVPDTIAIRVECEAAWDSLPDMLKSPRDALWHSGYSPKQLDTLILIKLFYLHTLFLAERALSRHTREISTSSLSTAYEMLSWVNDAMIRRDRLSTFAHTSLAWRVASFALPAAAVLALYLLRPASNSPLNRQEAVSRTQIIEGLSVLTAHLDVLFEPGDGNYQLFCEAKQVLQSIVEIVITPAAQRQVEDSLPDSAMGFSEEGWASVDQWGFDSDFWANLGDHPLLAPEMYDG
ncbi:hypothetical protein V500_08541 [Pseudogymnoascus sp. VKM F-4518 (FW-2643)]|nr:hypothetical protein V500_08541 [Pseudogymnoascus sp. VKM F-4518 (FW-2643)]